MALGFAFTTEAQNARALAPLAPTIDGVLSKKSGKITGSYAGREVRVGFWMHQTRGDGNGSRRIRLSYIEMKVVPGRCNWDLMFVPDGWRIFSPYVLQVVSSDKELLTRLEKSGVMEAVAAVNGPKAKEHYAPVCYSAPTGILEYRNMLPRNGVLTGPALATQLELVARLAAVNEQVNGEHPTTSREIRW